MQQRVLGVGLLLTSVAFMYRAAFIGQQAWAFNPHVFVCLGALFAGIVLLVESMP